MSWLRSSYFGTLSTAILGLLPGLAWAGPATDYKLFNTGVNDMQVPLGDNEEDLHYELIEPSHVVGRPIVATSKGGFPVGPWLDDNKDSAWITPANDTNGDGDVDGAPSYIYRTTFDLTGKPLGGLTINGNWSTDNQGLDILLNGNSLGFMNTAQFTSWTPFTLDTGFVNGINTLDFVLNNGANEANPFGPTGLRVEFEGNVGPELPPEPPHPQAIRTLFATGVNEFGQALVGDVVEDPHWRVAADAEGNPQDAFTVPSDGFPIPPWRANDANSRWIAHPSDADANGVPGTYVYETTFDLTGLGLDPTRAVIAGSRGTDDLGPTMLLNGVEVPIAGSRGFVERSWFGISSASAQAAGAEIKPGVNMLAFVVENGDTGDPMNPTGFRIDDLFARAAPIGSVPIPGLFNTGVDDNGLPLEDGAEDPHYKMVVAPDETVDPATALAGPPSPPWAENSGSSRWIGPNNDAGGNGPPGDYEFEIEFDLTGLDPSTAKIMGLWSSDNTGSDILLNGVATNNPQGGSFPVLSEFEISAEKGHVFQPGTNKLTFRVNNAGDTFNPAGVRVEGLLAFAMPSGLAGDFNNNGSLDAGDIDLLSAAVRQGPYEARLDLNSDGTLDQADRSLWVNTLANTYFGDSNLDKEFNSADFVLVFQAGQYEDAVALNSTWGTGDWNGDGEFNSTDFVLAFQEGGYEKGPRPGVAGVPEPSSVLLMALGLLSIVGRGGRMLRSRT
jgi:hypothetical protein